LLGLLDQMLVCIIFNYMIDLILFLPHTCSMQGNLFQQRPAPHRTAAFFLALLMVLPSPALALRPMNAGMEEQSPMNAQLQGALSLAASGLETAAGAALLQTTVLNAWHKTHSGRMVPFGGFEMPVQYTSILEEYTAVRTATGLFDVSHMGIVEVKGADAARFLNRVATHRVDTLAPGDCQVCFLFNDEGDLVDETMIFKLAEDNYRLVVNAGHSGEVIDWFEQVKARDEFSGRQIEVDDLRQARDPKDSRVILALQGPQTLDLLGQVMSDTDYAAIRDMAPLTHREVTVAGVPVGISKTGWSGEKGFEFILHSDNVLPFWSALIDLGIPPIGLGARDQLRLEASLRLRGDDFGGEPKITPGEAGYGNLGFINWNSDFIGREALSRAETVSIRRVVNVVVTGASEGEINPDSARRLPRLGYVVRAKDDDGQWQVVGEIRSSGLSKIWEGYSERGLHIASALLYDRAYARPGQELQIELPRGQFVYARVLPDFFYWNGWGSTVDLTKMRRFLKAAADEADAEAPEAEFSGLEERSSEGITLEQRLALFRSAARTTPFFVIAGGLEANPVVRAFAGLERSVVLHDPRHPESTIVQLAGLGADGFTVLGGLEAADPLLSMAAYAGMEAIVDRSVLAGPRAVIQRIFERMGVPDDLLSVQLPALMGGLEALALQA